MAFGSIAILVGGLAVAILTAAFVFFSTETPTAVSGASAVETAPCAMAEPLGSVAIAPDEVAEVVK